MNPFSQTFFRWRLSASKRICKGQGHCWRFLKMFGLHVANQIELSKWLCGACWANKNYIDLWQFHDHMKWCVQNVVLWWGPLARSSWTPQHHAKSQLQASQVVVGIFVEEFICSSPGCAKPQRSLRHAANDAPKSPNCRSITLPIPDKTRDADEHQCQQTKFQESYKAWVGLSKKNKKNKTCEEKMFESQTSAKWIFCGNFACLGFFF